MKSLTRRMKSLTRRMKSKDEELNKKDEELHKKDEEFNKNYEEIAYLKRKLREITASSASTPASPPVVPQRKGIK